ncbi:PREDICTED: uncharacterized protein LOC109156666 [Ipomoea nil]|uniref:uncharacterized protein LOC109156666 n=1 Tax=Ipomoea nil TaxID=35883 RepID=UPI0009015B2C|nr:PREDICTED: uncharacterized protein LOC109156666 [Ipomoea nil]
MANASSANSQPADGTSPAENPQAITPAVATTTPPSNVLHQAHHYVSIKLTATNYLFWRAQLVPFLKGQNLFGFVDGTSVCPPELVAASSSDAPPVVNPLCAQWIQQDQSILSMLFSSLAEEVLYLATGHASKPSTRGLFTHGVSQPCLVLVEQLTQAGRPVNLDEQNLHVFRGLRSEYRALVASLTSKSAPLTLPEVADLLATHQYLFADDASPPLPQFPSALFTQQPAAANPPDGNRGRGRNHRG